jgi:hypothetical protein
MEDLEGVAVDIACQEGVVKSFTEAGSVRILVVISKLSIGDKG